ncbi:MAG: replication initiation factor, partial [Zoogloeaceae bacterium]|nr:replication initiation factor [Zoogloeaceae bacterium]
LDQKGVSKLYAVLAHLNGLWSYATTEWLKLTLPKPEDQTRSRWPIHPLWVALASIDWETDGGPLSPRFSTTRAPQGDWLCRQGFSALTSFMAMEREWDFWQGWRRLGERVESHYFARTHLQGVKFEQFVEEQVRIKGRRFNTLDNCAEIPNEDRLREEFEESVREYRRQTRGG